MQNMKKLMQTIKDLQEILDNPERCKEVMKEELQEVKEKYGDARRTEIIPDEHEFNAEELFIQTTLLLLQLVILVI